MKKGFYCSSRDVSYAGSHLILEVWDAKNLDSLPIVEKALVEAVKACGATLLKLDLHKFTPFGGISGVAIIQESHISIHSWPEFSYAALDVFVCGNVNPYKAIPVFQKYFETDNIQVMEFKRGILEVNGVQRQMVLRDTLSGSENRDSCEEVISQG